MCDFSSKNADSNLNASTRLCKGITILNVATQSQYTILAPKEAYPTWPRHGQFPAVGSAGWTAYTV